MKKGLGFIIVSGLILILLYLIAWFIWLEPNVTSWSIEGRAYLVFAWFMGTSISAVMYFMP